MFFTGHLAAAIVALLSIAAFCSFTLGATFDYVVVGGGTAGITLAARLVEHGFRVALVEAGGYYELKHPTARVPGAAILGIGADPKKSSLVDWRFVVHGGEGTAHRDIHYSRGKCMGGSPSEDAMRRWAELTEDPSFLFENTLPFYQETTNFTPPGFRTGVKILYNESAFSPSGSPLHVSYPQCPMPFSLWAQQAFPEVGISEAEDFNSGSILGHQFCAMTIRATDQSRSSSESAFIGAPHLRDLTIYQKTMAKRILFNQNRAVGVRVKQFLTLTLKATREVIICAGVFQSPQLLMVSGIGPADLLHQHGIRIIADRPGLLPQYRSILSAQDEQDLSWFPADWPEVEYLAAAAYVGNYSNPFGQQPRMGQYGSIIGTLVAPTSRGNVSIQSAYMADPQIINPNWLETETDQRVAVASYRRIRDIFKTEVMNKVLTGTEYFPGLEVETDAEILELIKQTMMTIYHAACTCEMGIKSDRMAVVDSHARVFGVSGLRVVDASAFPFLPPGHPQSTVYMLAEKIAADIAGS